MEIPVDRIRHSGSVLAPLLVAVLAGCAGGTGTNPPAGDAPRERTAGSGPSSSNDQDRQRQFAACLREHGMSVPDPEPGRGLQLDSASSPQAREAIRACQQYAPSGSSGRGRVDADPATFRAYADCMRNNGVPDFPDPDPEAGMLIPKRLLDSANYAAAERTCAPILAKQGSGKK